MTSITMEDFEKLVRGRRSTRHFRPDPLPVGLLARLLAIAQWAPSGYNLQPAHFVVVTDPALRKKLRHACMNQAQVEESPAVVVFTGDRNVHKTHFERMVAQEREAGAINESYEKLLRRVVPLAFGRGPLGLQRAVKAALGPVLGFLAPVPEFPAVHMRTWVNRQVMLPAMVFMLAAHAAGLSSVPMEGFDGRRVRRVLGIPRSQIVTVVVPVGYAKEGQLVKTRLPIEEVTHWNGWHAKT